jgi:hypothetical protein
LGENISSAGNRKDRHGWKRKERDGRRIWAKWLIMIKLRGLTKSETDIFLPILSFLLTKNPWN